MTPEVKVRIGAPEDCDQVMALAKLMHDEIGITAFNPALVLPEIYGALSRDHGIMGLIGEPGGVLEAGVLLRIGKFFYSDEDVLEEKGLFVHPDFRTAKGNKRPHAVRLCEFSKQAAQSLGLPLFIGVQNDVRTKGKLRLYERQFGEPIGAFFLYRPDAEQAEAA